MLTIEPKAEAKLLTSIWEEAFDVDTSAAALYYNIILEHPNNPEVLYTAKGMKPTGLQHIKNQFYKVHGQNAFPIPVNDHRERQQVIDLLLRSPIFCEDRVSSNDLMV
jgi:hypothetical protein